MTPVAAIVALALLVAGPGPRAVEAQTGVSAAYDERDGVNVRGLVTDSLRMLTLQHLIRTAQAKTRAELGGPFFADYTRSVRVPRQWGDGDGWMINYVGHPVQGAASAFIWLDHDPRASYVFASTPDYWRSRLRGMVWAAVYSVQFEVGLLSEASIGNVGLRRETVGWVDHVMTPAGGFLIAVGEDVMDRFVLAKLEGKGVPPLLRATLRMVFNPGRAMANVAAARTPWHRADRPLKPGPEAVIGDP